MSGEFDHIFDLIGERAFQMNLDQAEEVERRILAGENEIEIPYLLGKRASDPRTLKYTVPKWRRAPRIRLRIEIARRKHRRDRIAALEREVEEERLKAADILVRLQADLLKRQSIDTREHAREAFSQAGEMVEKAFRDLVPEKWWRELAEFDARAEAEGS